jgi:hypothetical protein
MAIPFAEWAGWRGYSTAILPLAAAAAGDTETARGTCNVLAEPDGRDIDGTSVYRRMPCSSA